jgi:hypothetical protein
MTFFDPKEDVIDVEITQFGKFLLSKGKWDPIYYAFFDDDIIYDSQYGGVTEAQNDIQARITGSARTRDQYVFSGIETEISKLMQVEMNPEASEMQKISIQATDDREYALSYPLGRSDTGNQNNPAWAITFLKGELSSSIPYSTSSLGVVPRVQMFADDVKFYTESKNKVADDQQSVCDEETGEVEETLVQVGESSDSQVDPSDLVFANKVYPDGSYIDIKEDYLLLEMLEKNTPFEEDNIDIEVFLYEDNIDTGKEVLTPLRFMKKRQAVVDGILLDDDDDERNQQAAPTPDCVEYFFNVRVDNEIPIDVLCRAVKERTDLGLYAPPIVCPEEFVFGEPPLPCVPPVCDDPNEDLLTEIIDTVPVCEED